MTNNRTINEDATNNYYIKHSASGKKLLKNSGFLSKSSR